MAARALIAITLLLAVSACQDKRPTFIEDPRSKGPQPEAAGTIDAVWGAAAVAYAESLYLIYRRGGHADLMPIASADLTDALREGRAPPIDPLCDCTQLGRLYINAQTLEVKPGIGAKVLVTVNNMDRPNNIYLYLAMTPLGFKLDDIASPSLRQGLVYYLRTNKKTDEEIMAERQARLEAGECDSLEEC